MKILLHAGINYCDYYRDHPANEEREDCKDLREMMDVTELMDREEIPVFSTYSQTILYLTFSLHLPALD